MFWGLCLQFTVLTYAIARAEVTIDLNGGFKNVIVAIDPKIPESKIKSHLVELKALFRNASKVLHIATRDQTFFEEIVFAVPKKYRFALSELEWVSNEKYFANPDFIVTFEDPFSNPYTLQNDACGRPGLRIHIPEEFLSSKDTDKAKTLVKEWAKYRYGVFDESGFVGDELYPECYTIPGTDLIEVTDCSDKEIVYNFRKNSKDPALCNPVPAYGKNNHVTSSLMSKTELPQVTQFCDDNSHPHNVNLPTKQNFLCREQSTWKVISQHQDFKFKPIGKKKKIESLISFKYAMEPEMRLIVAVDTSNNMLQNDRLDMVRNAFSYFVLYNIPEYSVVGLKNLKNKDSSPLLVSIKTPADAEMLIDAFPEAYGEEEVCIHCGIEQALQTLKPQSGNSQGQIVIISATDIDESRTKSLQNTLLKNEIKLHVLYFKQRLRGAPFLQKLAEVSQGFFYYIPDNFKSDSSVSSLTLIYEAFRSIYKSFSWMNEDHVLVEQNTFSKDSCTTCFISFQSDNTMENFQVLLTGPQFLVGPPVIRDKTVLSNGNQNFSAGHSSFSYKIKIPAYVFTIKNPKSNIWSLTFERRPGFDKPLVVIIRSNSKKDRIIAMKSWISVEETPKGVLPKHPRTKFYTEIKKGHLPVSNATVFASLYHLESKDEIRLDLTDIGDGDPDITANDGIFSRYFSEVSQSGYYILTVIAETYSLSLKESLPFSQSFRCCGSSYPLQLAYGAGPFKRTVTYGSFFIEQENTHLQFPPRRINNLKVNQVIQMNNRTLYDLKWTAPGNNYDYGIAIDYQLRVFVNRDDATNDFNQKYILIIDNFHVHGQMLEPDTVGTYQSVIIELKNLTSGTYYLAICTTNSNGDASDVSNIIEVYYTAPFINPIDPTATSITETTTSDFEEGKGALTDSLRLAIGLSIGFLLLSIIIGIILYLYFARKCKNRKAKEEKRQQIISRYGGGPSLDDVHKTESRDALYQSTNSMNISAISPINSWPANSLLSHYETLQKNKHSDTSDSSTIRPKDGSDTASDVSSKYSYINKGDQNSSMYDTIHFPPQHERDEVNFPYNPQYGPFNPPYTSSLRRDGDYSTVRHGYSSNSIDHYTYRSDRSPVHYLGTDL
ncbi:calcium-activated chloride channel regulator 2 [Nephila pilipes]|uniref:Calcium-activated chloride channel regulator 2 n=1 Tax=Nephila pilipes TaxID=299642 RepID=A0A8X6T6A1_NEPPI|nr:calcium-activated chloride channel regulator 2 [Nephila pilipes]